MLALMECNQYVFTMLLNVGLDVTTAAGTANTYTGDLINHTLARQKEQEAVVQA